MNCFKARQATFHSWPLSSPLPTDLAEAGFYYTGNPLEGEDTVTCFLCNKELGGWEGGDDPLEEHLAHAKTKTGCAWAILMKEKRSPRLDPQGSAMLKSREASFKGWPHEKERGWLGKGKKMAKAGFHYSPSIESADAVECIYCGLGLDGWEPKDDPLAEHERRAQGLNCAFFGGLISPRPSQSIFELAKNAFAAEKASQCSGESDNCAAESVASQASRRGGRKVSTVSSTGIKPSVQPESKKSSKKKLPNSRSKRISATPSDSPGMVMTTQQHAPIVLQSARKKRHSGELHDTDKDDVQILATKKSKIATSQRSSIDDSSDVLCSANSQKSDIVNTTSAKPRNRRARTPLEEIVELNACGAILSSAVIDPIAEEQQDLESHQSQAQSNSGSLALDDATVDGKENPSSRKLGTKRLSAATRTGTRIRQPRRGSATTKIQNIADIETSQLSANEPNHDVQIPILIEEEEIEDSVYSIPATQIADSVVNDKHKVRESSAADAMVKVAMKTRASIKNGKLARTGLEEPYATGTDPLISIPALRGRPIVACQDTVSRTDIKENPALIGSQVEISTRRTSTRRGSKDPHKRHTEDTVLEEVENPPIIIRGRRTSSRRRGSGTSTASNIEDIIMLDHKARPMPQRSSRPLRSSVTTRPMHSTESILEEADEFCQDVKPSSAAYRVVHKPAAAATSEMEESLDLLEKVPQYRSLSQHSVFTESEHQVQQLEQNVFTNQQEPELALPPNNLTPEAPHEIDTEGEGWDILYDQLLNAVRIHAMPEPAELSELDWGMTIEQWLRHYTENNVDRFKVQCEDMIERLLIAGERAKVSISAAI